MNQIQDWKSQIQNVENIDDYLKLKQDWGQSVAYSAQNDTQNQSIISNKKSIAGFSDFFDRNGQPLSKSNSDNGQDGIFQMASSQYIDNNTLNNTLNNNNNNNFNNNNNNDQAKKSSLFSKKPNRDINEKDFFNDQQIQQRNNNHNQINQNQQLNLQNQFQQQNNNYPIYNLQKSCINKQNLYGLNQDNNYKNNNLNPGMKSLLSDVDQLINKALQTSNNKTILPKYTNQNTQNIVQDQFSQPARPDQNKGYMDNSDIRTFLQSLESKLSKPQEKTVQIPSQQQIDSSTKNVYQNQNTESNSLQLNQQKNSVMQDNQNTQNTENISLQNNNQNQKYTNLTNNVYQQKQKIENTQNIHQSQISEKNDFKSINEIKLQDSNQEVYNQQTQPYIEQNFQEVLSSQQLEQMLDQQNISNIQSNNNQDIQRKQFREDNSSQEYMSYQNENLNKSSKYTQQNEKNFEQMTPQNQVLDFSKLNFSPMKQELIEEQSLDQLKFLQQQFVSPIREQQQNDSILQRLPSLQQEKQQNDSNLQRFSQQEQQKEENDPIKQKYMHKLDELMISFKDKPIQNNQQNDQIFIQANETYCINCEEYVKNSEIDNHSNKCTIQSQKKQIVHKRDQSLSISAFSDNLNMTYSVQNNESKKTLQIIDDKFKKFHQKILTKIQKISDSHQKISKTLLKFVEQSFLLSIIIEKLYKNNNNEIDNFGLIQNDLQTYIQTINNINTDNKLSSLLEVAQKIYQLSFDKLELLVQLKQKLNKSELQQPDVSQQMISSDKNQRKIFLKQNNNNESMNSILKDLENVMAIQSTSEKTKKIQPQSEKNDVKEKKDKNRSKSKKSKKSENYDKEKKDKHRSKSKRSTKKNHENNTNSTINDTSSIQSQADNSTIQLQKINNSSIQQSKNDCSNIQQYWNDTSIVQDSSMIQKQKTFFDIAVKLKLQLPSNHPGRRLNINVIKQEAILNNISNEDYVDYVKQKLEQCI